MVWTRNALGEVNYKRREYDKALEQALAILEMQPDDALTLVWAGLLYSFKNMPRESSHYAFEAG